MLWDALFYLVLPGLALASHFRGGIIMWKPNGINNQATITFRMAWRRSYSHQTFCDEDTKESGSIIAALGNIVCFGCNDGTISSTGFVCTDFSTSEDWSQGERSVNFTFSSPTVQFGFKGTAWISLVNGGSGWSLLSKADFTVRNDTGLINSSPVSAMEPIVRLQHGCNHIIKIPVSDVDGDDIRCRWARDKECASVCNGLPTADLKERECEITYMADKQIGWYAVALQIEDFNSTNSLTPLSSIPLQFLVKVFDSDKLCRGKPTFISPTRRDGSCVGVPLEKTWSEKIIARSDSNSIRIKEINTVSPVGLSKSNIDVYGSSGRDWYVNVSWTPVSTPFQEKIFCYTAIDMDGLSSVQECIKLLPGVEPPEVRLDTISPHGDIYPSERIFTVKFDKEFSRPVRSAYIYFYNGNGTVTYKIDASTSKNVQYPTGTIGREMRVFADFQFEEKEHYHIRLDPGVAKGNTYCGAESPAVWNSESWTFRVRDITPPVITFVQNPAITNGNITVQWEANEAVTSTCTLQDDLQVTSFPCNGSWTGTNLQEGFYTIFVQATDKENNVAVPKSYTWRIDKTGPVVRIVQSPPTLSNQKEVTIKFYCDENCVSLCKLMEDNKGSILTNTIQGSAGKVVTFHLSSNHLQNNKTYTFSVVPTDEAGNAGNITKTSWNTDFVPPIISTVPDITINCRESNKPNKTGFPTANDTSGIPTLMYRDNVLANCKISRQWTATDRAGNIAESTQILTISSNEAPRVILPDEIIVACGSLSEVTEDIVRPSVKVSHPCGLPINITFQDPPEAERCGVTFERTWIFSDNCGKTVKGIQFIQVLDLQEPVAPTRSQITDLTPLFMWHDYPGSTLYKIFIWKQGSQRPIYPSSVQYTTSYRQTALDSGSVYFWQIEYVLQNSNQTIYSPRWNFKTKDYPDLSVETILIPPIAHSGETFVVEWSVQNIGKASTDYMYWYDAVYVGFSTNFETARRISTVYQRHILFSNDTYKGKQEIKLKETDIGLMFVFVKVDFYKLLEDRDRSNNFRGSGKAVDIKLTPPPDLQVDSVIIPKTSYSGQEIEVVFSVSNHGRGTIVKHTWYDELYWSKDQVYDTSDVRLLKRKRDKGLIPDEQYTVAEKVSIPNNIYGTFHVIAITDKENNVYEHQLENNNQQSSGNITVSLTPPPDLSVVEMMLSSGNSYKTGDPLIIHWTVQNIGFRAPYINIWTDDIILSSNTNSRTIETFYNLRNLAANEMYTRELEVTIDSTIESGLYNLSVVTDSKASVFEYMTRRNNRMSQLINITQALPDLYIQNITMSIIHGNKTPNALNVSWIVRNAGKGPTSKSSWIDSIEINNNILVSRKPLSDILIQNTSLRTTDIYRKSVIIDLPITFHGHQYITIVIDKLQVEADGNRKNNEKTSYIHIPLKAPDLLIQFVELSEKDLRSGDNFYILWNVTNYGTEIQKYSRWRDSISLQPSSQRNSFPLSYRGNTIDGSDVTKRHYSRQTRIKIPDDFVGYAYIHLTVNVGESLYEGHRLLNNTKVIPVRINAPPSADFIVTNVSAYILNNQLSTEKLVIVQWVVRNNGNLMSDIQTWVDSIGLSSTSHLNGQRILLTSFPQSYALESGAEYSLSKTIVIPSSVVGQFYAFVHTDSEDNVKEVNGENNNIGFDHKSLDLLSTRIAKLTSNIHSVSECQESRYICVFYRVTNVGNKITIKTSWNDAIFVANENNLSVDKLLDTGRYVLSKTHIGQLKPEQFYTENISIDIETLKIKSDFYFFVLPEFENAESYSDHSNNLVGFNNKSVIYLETRTKLPNLKASMIANLKQMIGGQPLPVTFNVTNNGERNIQSTIYVAFYLSADIEINAFEQKLRTQKFSVNIPLNETVQLNSTVFLPFDIVTKDYYFITQVDSSQKIIETNEKDNIAYSILTIARNVPTDIVVIDVTSPNGYTYGKEMSIKWKLRNNGTINAVGYKCDSVFLSEDKTWDITDEAMGTSKCNYIDIKPFSKSFDEEMNTIVALAPPVKGDKFHTIVKSRTNILDNNLDNNIGISNTSTSVTFQTLTLEEQITIELGISDNKIFRIPNVSSDNTLIISAIGNNSGMTYEVFLKFEKPPTDYDFDVTVSDPYSSTQRLLYPNTKKGNYFILIRYTGAITSDNRKTGIIMKATIAKFEIFDSFPKTASALGNVTLQISGALIPESISIILFNEIHQLKASKIFWFSSTSIAASFNVVNITKGTSLSLNVTDNLSGEITTLPDALTIVQGIAGKVVARLLTPGPLFFGQKDVFHIDIQNVGDSDIYAPLIVISTDKAGQIRYVNDYHEYDWSTSFTFITGVKDGPGGILPPKQNRRLSFETQSNPGEAGRVESKITVSLIEPRSDKPHPYLEKRNEVKPYNYDEQAWDRVWNNFLKLVGNSWKSLNFRVAQIMDEMSIAGYRKMDLEDAVDYLVDVADGILPEMFMEQTFDKSFELSDIYRFSYIGRIYPNKIGMRMTKGPLGQGWMLPLLETSLQGVSENTVVLRLYREDFLFTVSSFGYYVNEEKGVVYFEEADFICYEETKSNNKYVFNSTSGSLVSVENISGEKLTLAYNNDGSLVNVQQHLKTVFLSYDEKKRIRAANMRKDGSVDDFSCSYAYNDRNLLESVKCDDRSVIYSYNEYGDLREIIEGNATCKLLSYTEEGFLQSIKTVLETKVLFEKNYTYFGNGKITVFHKPENTETAIWINTQGHLTAYKRRGYPIKKFVPQMTSELVIEGDSIIRQIFHGDNKKVITDGNGDTVTVLNNLDGQIETYQDGKNNLFDVVRNFNKTIQGIGFPDNTYELLNYYGSKIELTTRNNARVAYIFDDADKLILREIDIELSIRYNYNEFEYIKGVYYDNTSVHVGYDDKSRLISIVYPNGITISHEYMKNNNLLATKIDVMNYDIEYQYNEYGQITSMRNRADNTTVVNIIYNINGLISEKILGNGAKTFILYYNNTNKVKSIVNQYPNDSVASSFEYTYDRRNRLISVETLEGFWKYRYDQSGQIISVQEPSGDETVYTYDPSKNRISIEEQGYVKPYTVNNLNQYTVFNGNETMQYDRNGNMIKKGDVSLVYDEENKLVMFTTANNNCSIEYDAFKTIRKKTCLDSTTNYYTDENGKILLEVRNNTDNLYIYGDDNVGLVAVKTTEGYNYFQFDVHGSIISVTDEDGIIKSSKTYHPFGVANNLPSTVDILFGYIGKAGVISFAELPGLYLIGSRLYDAQLGRFLTVNKFGLFCLHNNMYNFAGNNPLNVSQVRTEAIDGDCSLTESERVLETLFKRKSLSETNKGSSLGSNSNIFTSDKNGFPCVRHRRAASRNGTQNSKERGRKKMKPGALQELVFNVFNVDELLKDLPPSISKKIKKSVGNALDSVENKLPLPWRYGLKGANFLYKHRKCLLAPCDCIQNVGQGLEDRYNDIKNKVNDFWNKEEQIERELQTTSQQINRILHPGSASCNACQRFFQGVGEIKNTVKSVQKKLENTADKMVSKAKEYTNKAADLCRNPEKLLPLAEGLIQWIRSFDPNDIIGPGGYGAAKFIPRNIDMIYTIRFENYENATAPAQRVIVEIELDVVMNARAFRLGSFGFGNFLRELDFKRTFIQEKINLTADFGVFVDVRGGLDIINNKATWEFQAIDPQTGFAPSDPSIGFLPPNNGTSGQGFVKFSIRASRVAKNLDKIKAKAVIFFDANEPIETPEIFNTLDDAPPYVNNITILQDALRNGSLILNMDITDGESGLNYVTIMLETDNGSVPLLHNVRESLVSLPLQSGNNYEIFLIPVDNIGNVPATVTRQHRFNFSYPVPEVSCEEVRNCSGNGHCAGNNFCICLSGYFGKYCSEDSPPPDPPVLELHSGIQENISVPLFLSSFTTFDENVTILVLKCLGFPKQSFFSKGQIMGNELHLSSEDFGKVLFVPPSNYIGNFTISATAESRHILSSQSGTRSGSFDVTIDHSISEEERHEYLSAFEGYSVTTGPITRTATVITTKTAENSSTTKQLVIGIVAGGCAFLFLLTVIIIVIKQKRKSNA